MQSPKNYLKKQTKHDECSNQLISLYSKAAGSQAFIQQLFLKLLDDLKNLQELKYLTKLIVTYEALLNFNIQILDDDKSSLMRERIQSQKIILKLQEQNNNLMTSKTNNFHQTNHTKNSYSQMSLDHENLLIEGSQNWSSQLYSLSNLRNSTEIEDYTKPVFKSNQDSIFGDDLNRTPSSPIFKSRINRASKLKEYNLGFFHLIEKSNIQSKLYKNNTKK